MQIKNSIKEKNLFVSDGKPVFQYIAKNPPHVNFEVLVAAALSWAFLLLLVALGVGA